VFAVNETVSDLATLSTASLAETLMLCKPLANKTANIKKARIAKNPFFIVLQYNTTPSYI
jgi:hypothetical protein